MTTTWHPCWLMLSLSLSLRLTLQRSPLAIVYQPHQRSRQAYNDEALNHPFVDVVVVFIAFHGGDTVRDGLIIIVLFAVVVRMGVGKEGGEPI